MICVRHKSPSSLYIPNALRCTPFKKSKAAHYPLCLPEWWSQSSGRCDLGSPITSHNHRAGRTQECNPIISPCVTDRHAGAQGRLATDHKAGDGGCQDFFQPRLYHCHRWTGDHLHNKRLMLTEGLYKRDRGLTQLHSKPCEGGNHVCFVPQGEVCWAHSKRSGNNPEMLTPRSARSSPLGDLVRERSAIAKRYAVPSAMFVEVFLSGMMSLLLFFLLLCALLLFEIFLKN